MKINKTHKGKEFQSFFHFVGQVNKSVKGYGDDREVIDIYRETPTTTGKMRRVLQFDVLTDKYNKLRVEMAGMEREKAYAYSSKHKRSFTIDWKDRNDKSKLPDDTYHIIAPEWDKTKELSAVINDGMWVEVKGHYRFDKMTNDEGKEYLIVKREISNVEPIENGQEIKLNSAESVKYVCDFDDPDFKEVNRFDLEVGIKSVYQDEETRNTKINGVFLEYGKERSTPKDLELNVYYKKPLDGKKALADAFTALNRLDIVQVRGVDNNRPEFAFVTETAADDDPFADVDEKVESSRMVVSGTKKGLEVTHTVGKVHRDALTEEEITEEFTFEYTDDVPFN